MQMDIQETRRRNLRSWVERHGRPSAEKSYFSQLLKDQSFGERVARRLERQYGMGEGFLDAPISAPIFNPPIRDQKDALSIDAQMLIRAIQQLDAASDSARKLFPSVAQMLNIASSLASSQNVASVVDELRMHEQTISDALGERLHATRRRKEK